MSNLQTHDLTQLKTFQLFQSLDSRQLESMILGSCVKYLKHRDYFFREGDAVKDFCIILEGAIKLLRHSPRGEDIIMHFALKGDVVGALLMNQKEGAIYPISAKAMGSTRILCIPKSTFRQHWLDATIQSRLNSLLYQRMNSIQDDKTMSTSPLKVRVSNLLLKHLDHSSDEINQTLSIKLTRQEIADALGVAVESVIRTMREMYSEGTINKASDKSDEVINIEKLLKNLEL